MELLLWLHMLWSGLCHYVTMKVSLIHFTRKIDSAKQEIWKYAKNYEKLSVPLHQSDTTLGKPVNPNRAYGDVEIIWIRFL